MADVVQSRPRAGRQRDPSIAPKVTAAVIRVYAHKGWAGLTFEAIAREADVGKPAIYRRWSSREDLLVHVFDALDFPTARDCGSLRADMLDYALQWVDWYADQDRGLAGMRLWPDCQTNPELADLYEQVLIGPRRHAALDITYRAIARGELHPSVRPSALVDIIIGALQVHWSFTPLAKLDKLHATFAARAEELIQVLTGGLPSLPIEPASADGGSTRRGSEFAADQHPSLPEPRSA
jgi:AcrR family transcriptional regulator